MLLKRRGRLYDLRMTVCCVCISFLSIFTYFHLIMSQDTTCRKGQVSETSSPNKLTSTTTVTTTITTTTTACLPFTIPDNRSFYEREPPSVNLPRYYSESSRENVIHQLQSIKLVAVACARNVSQSIDGFRKHIEPIMDLFHPSSRILILESDSTDGTLEKLMEWSRAEVHTNGNLSGLIVDRSERIAYCRNELIKRATTNKFDYILVADIDIFRSSISAFISNFMYNTDEWALMTASTSDAYYDIWALRTLSDSNLNFDVWHTVWSLMRSNLSYCSASIVDLIIRIHQKPIPTGRGLIEVRSAFGGAGLYRADAVGDCEYSGKNSTCEHVPFNTCVREKNNGRIFINPEFQIG